jgi:hypothetical protein
MRKFVSVFAAGLLVASIGNAAASIVEPVGKQTVKNGVQVAPASSQQVAHLRHRHYHCHIVVTLGHARKHCHTHRHNKVVHHGPRYH